MLKLMIITLTVIVFQFPVKTFAQEDTTKTTFLSKLYFPFDFGYTISNQLTISNGGSVKTGIEYRLKNNNGLFVRFNFDNRNNNYKISEKSSTNIIEGEIKFNDYVLGLGYRIGKKKIKLFGLSQAGISMYNFPSIIGVSTCFKIKENQASTSVFKTTLGLEYYVAKNAALTIETVYILQTTNSTFWHKSLSTFGISIGLTTTLF